MRNTKFQAIYLGTILVCVFSVYGGLNREWHNHTNGASSCSNCFGPSTLKEPIKYGLFLDNDVIGGRDILIHVDSYHLQWDGYLDIYINVDENDLIQSVDFLFDNDTYSISSLASQLELDEILLSMRTYLDSVYATDATFIDQAINEVVHEPWVELLNSCTFEIAESLISFFQILEGQNSLERLWAYYQFLGHMQGAEGCPY